MPVEGSALSRIKERRRGYRQVQAMNREEVAPSE
jgi:hypothetical protein